MQDNTPDFSIQDLPPCPLSIHCFQLLDALDEPQHGYQRLFAISDVSQNALLADAQWVDRLRAHTPNCPTCSAVLARARSMRLRQRSALQSLLLEGEQRVPSTVARIMQTVGSERHATSVAYDEMQESERVAFQKSEYEWERKQPEVLYTSRSRMRWRTIFSFVAVAAIICTSLGMFSHAGTLHSTTETLSPKASSMMSLLETGTISSHPLASSMPSFRDWNNVLIVSGNASSGSVRLNNVDVRNGITLALEDKLLPGTHVDGISPDGESILYSNAGKGATSYWVRAKSGGSKIFYSLSNAEAGDAIWQPDSRSVLIATTSNGILQVDTVTGQAVTLLPALKTGGIRFYHYPYLYFIGAENLHTGALYRMNITDKSVQQVTERTPGTTFWLAPDGSTVYYVNKGSAGQPGLYRVDGNITHQSWLGRNGVPIGYAEDNALMMMRQVQGKFQVVKLGATPSQDSVVLDDVVPGAVSLCDGSNPPGIALLCDSNIALAPLGRSLVVAARYADGSRKLWSIDLNAGKSIQLTGLDELPSLQLIGWNKIS